MPPKPRRQDIVKLNTLLSSQNEAISNMRLFSDDDQNESLVNRSHIMKSNHKYLQKIDKAEDIIKEARQMNAERSQIVKNSQLRKNVVRREPSQQTKNLENVKNMIEKSKYIPPIMEPSTVRVKAKSQNSTFMDRKVQEQISRIEQMKQPPDETAEHVLPKQILEGEITKSIVSVQYLIVKNYFKDKIKGINASTSPEQIYRIMNPFYELCGVKIALPLIKKYKNCAYFGNSNKEGQVKYEGFLILHQEEKLYYGEFHNEKKNGKGTEIDFQNDAVFIGTFTKGRKNGQFNVIKPHQKYVGQVLKGQYHGYGQLASNFSVYKGYFENGQRHGEGQQKFLQMGLTICGTFVNNKFTNNAEKIQHSRINTINSKSQAQQTRSKASNTPAQKSINPENTPNRLFHDKNVVFQASAISKRNFQEFDCEFGAEVDEDIDELEVIDTRKVPHFRIKQVKQPHKAFTQRKRTISQQKSSLLYSILKS